MQNVEALQFTTSKKAAISLAKTGSSPSVSLEYSYDGIDWSDWDLSDLTINSGDTLFIRGYNPKGFSSSSIDYYTFVIEGDKVSCSGNIMSLIDYRRTLDTIPCDYCFHELFYKCTSLVSAPELPATNLKAYCYYMMFNGCSSLKTAPELPAMTLAKWCYRDMFAYCTSLKTAPELPAMTLADYCYYAMFADCTSLKSAPKLPATILAEWCYYAMFYNCTSLKSAPKLPAKSVKDMCYGRMFYNCTSLTSAPNQPIASLAEWFAFEMFYGCTSLKAKRSTMSLKEYCQSHLSSMLND